MSSDSSRTIPVDTHVQAFPRQISSEAGDEEVVLHLDTGQYHGLEGVGAFVWRLVREGATVGELESAIRREYEVEPDRCRDDLQTLLAELHERKLVEFHNEPPR